MAYSIAAKFLGSLLGIVSFFYFPSLRPYLQTAILGIAPIWLELLACKLFQVEPGAERRKNWRLMDAAADSFSFLLMPVAVFLALTCLDPGTHWSLPLSAGVFLAAGLFRIARFLREGLTDGCFLGLPVTYTGYLWPLLAFLVDKKLAWMACFLLLLFAWLMVWKKLKLKSI